MATDDSGIDYYRDNALKSKEDDQFQHEHYVSVLRDILLRSQTPINVGLYGKWGVGKSSILHMLEGEIKKDEKLKDFKYVEVDAWGISGKSLQQGILEEINAKLKFPFGQEELEDKLYNVHQVDSIKFSKLLKSYGWIWAAIGGLSIPAILHAGEDVIGTLSFAGFASIVAILLPLSRLFFSTSKRIIPRVVSTVQFNKIYDKIIKKQKKKLVVVIDNLDRCEDTVAVELLGIIQTFMVKDNCINILACDDEAIVTHLKNVKRNYSDKDGNEFLSKFFQVTIRIPPFIGENLSAYTEKLIKKRNVPFDPFVKPILISGAIENPRKINQFLNIAVALYRLAELKENAGKLQKGIITGNTNFLMKIIVIRHEWPEFYKALEINHNLLNNNVELDGWYRGKLKENKISEEEINRLKKFLNATKISYVKDIAPFLRLNQESYAAESGIGKFEDAFITLDPKAIEIFKKLNDEKQDQYLNKIKDLMKNHELEPEKLTLLNCALSLIDILPYINNKGLRGIALSILGEYLSSQLLDHWDKFDIDQLGLFEILEETNDIFSEPFYNRLLSESFKDDTINEDLLEEFFKNGIIINTKILDQIDKELRIQIQENNYSNMEFITKCIQNYNWSENKITKPSQIVSYIISEITFDETPETQKYREIYENIKNEITDEENEKFYTQILEIIDKSRNSNTTIPPRLLEFLKENPIEDFKVASKEKEKIFVSLCNLIKNNPDLNQCNEILEMLISMLEKIQKISEKTIEPDKHLEEAFVNYANRSDANMLKNLCNHITESKLFLEKISIMIAIVNRYKELGSNIPEIIQFLLKIKSYSIEAEIITKFEEMIKSSEEPGFTTLLTTAKEENSEFNSDLVRKIGKICLREAEDEETPIRHAMYEYAFELNPDSYDKTKISEYATNLIDDENPTKQELGFTFSRKINAKISNGVKPVGITNAIKTAKELIDDNSERVVSYLGFIFEFKDKLTFSQTYALTSLLKKGLQANLSENITNNIIAYGKQSPDSIIINTFDELIEFAKNTRFANAKEQCKEILLSHKDNLRSRHKESIKEIYGENILD